MRSYRQGHPVVTREVAGSSPAAPAICGSSSVVEPYVANVDVAGSNPVSRSILSHYMKYKVNDTVLVKSYAGPNIRVILKKRYVASQSKHKLGVDGWEAHITLKSEVEKLRRHGVPYKKGDKPEVWVFDWQIIKKY